MQNSQKPLKFRLQKRTKGGIAFGFLIGALIAGALPFERLEELMHGGPVAVPVKASVLSRDGLPKDWHVHVTDFKMINTHHTLGGGDTDSFWTAELEPTDRDPSPRYKLKYLSPPNWNGEIEKLTTVDGYVHKIDKDTLQVRHRETATFGEVALTLSIAAVLLVIGLYFAYAWFNAPDDAF